ncbi:MAG: Rid family detoxifying hydrolase [Bacillota bacterium]|nr:Rid family detoxifying hydrolase [Bacillota bacterium]
MKREIIPTAKAPAPVGPYSNVVKYGNLLFISGMASEDAVTGEILHGTVTEQTENIMKNIKAILEDVGSSMGLVLKCSIHMTRPEYFSEMNSVYGSYFNEEDGYPARVTTFGSEIYDGLDVEIDVIAGIEE